MTLNCKPGDLARVISEPETVLVGVADKIVRVTSIRGFTINGTALWHYEGHRLVCACGCCRQIDGIGDNLLRPIRGQEGDDETLVWAGKPADVTVPATV